MLRMYGYDGGTPMHRAYRGLVEADPGVVGIGGDAVDLTVLPRWTECGVAPGLHRAEADAWYDLLWTAPGDRLLLDVCARARSAPAERRRLRGALAGAGLLPAGQAATAEDVEAALAYRAGTARVLLSRALDRAGVLPMPEVIPVRERLEALAPVTLDGVPSSHITLLGGTDAALRFLQQRQTAAVRDDRTADIYDWGAWGCTAAETVRALPVWVVA